MGFGPTELLILLAFTIVLFGFGPPGAGELLILLAIVLLIFGAKKLPELARGIGKSVTSFKTGLNEGAEEEAEVAAQKEKETTQKEETG